MPHTTSRIRTRAAAALIGGWSVFVPAARAQRAAEPKDLHGSRASVEKMYDFATSHHLSFYLTPETLDDGIARGRLVPLTGDSTFDLARGVGFSYATREARDFVVQFAPQYLAACGSPLTVTSAARPTTRQPHNANPLSVHPTGIAVDLRRPPSGPCLTWVRGALDQLERRGYVEATEEHHPVHIHIAVLTEPGRPVRLPLLYTGTPVPRIVVPDSTSSVASGAAAAARVEQFAMMEGGDIPTHVRGGVRLAALTGGGVMALASRSTAIATERKGGASRTMMDRAATARTYRVRVGDTLWEVAQRTGVSVRTLAAANHLRSRTMLRPGITLQLPAGR